jgi:hypothetical protein
MLWERLIKVIFHIVISSSRMTAYPSIRKSWKTGHSLIEFLMEDLPTIQDLEKFNVKRDLQNRPQITISQIFSFKPGIQG